MSKLRDKKKRSYELRKARRFAIRAHNRAERHKRIKKYLYLIRLIERKKRKFCRPNNSINSDISFDNPPKDMRFLNNTAECAKFFTRLHKMRKYGNSQKVATVSIDMSEVEHIDFAATMIFTAICEDLGNHRMNVNGNSPQRNVCKQYLIESGFYNNKYDANGIRIIEPGNSSFTYVGRGDTKITLENLKEFYRITEKAFKYHKTSVVEKIERHSSLIKEICGNSAEWGGGKTEKWVIGTKEEDDKTIFVALDLGNGILNSLHRKFDKKLKELFASATSDLILDNAFERKYGSKSQEPNRNQGLPYIRKCAMENLVDDMSVVTNNVKLKLADKSQNSIFSSRKSAFKGTLYSWIIKKQEI